MNKSDLIAAIAEKTGQSKADAGRSLEAMLDAIAEQLENGGDVAIIGFGSFKISERAARNGRNPKTGETINIAAAKLPKFVPGKALKERIAG